MTELAWLSSPSFPGIWLTVAKGPVRGQRREGRLVVGLISCSQLAGLEDHLSSCVRQVVERYGEGVELVVGGNQSLQGQLGGLHHSSPGLGQFLLQSPSLDVTSQLLPHLGPGAVLCSLPPSGCSLCNVALPSQQELEEHRTGPQHLRNMDMEKLQQHLEVTQGPHLLGLKTSLSGECEGVTQGPGREVRVATEPGRETQFHLQLINCRAAPGDCDSTPQGIVVKKVAVPGGQQVVRLEDKHGLTDGRRDNMVRIRHGRRYRLTVTCRAGQVGEHRVPVAVVFFHDAFSEPEATERGFQRRVSLLVVEVVVTVETLELRKMLPVEPFYRKPRDQVHWQARKTYRGYSIPPDYKEDFLVVQLAVGDFPLAEERRERILALFQDGQGEQLQRERGLLCEELSQTNYSDRFQLLLHCEQAQEELETRQLDLAGVEVRLERRTGLVVLQVPGVQEGGRRLLRGDRLFLRRQGDTETEYEAFVHRAEGAGVWLGCGKRLLDSLAPSVLWDVRFSVNLQPVRLAARAVTLASSHGLTAATLFPCTIHLRAAPGLHSLKCFNPLVAANPEQRTAVEVIVSGLSGAAPVGRSLNVAMFLPVTGFSSLTPILSSTSCSGPPAPARPSPWWRPSSRSGSTTRTSTSWPWLPGTLSRLLQSTFLVMMCWCVTVCG